MSSSRALRSLFVAAAIVVSAAAPAKPAKKTLAAEAGKLHAVASDTSVVEAVKKQNARELTLKAVKLLDNRWFVGKESGLVKQTLRGPCADRLREFLAANPAHSEAFVLDAQGAVVCADSRTLNFWYGEQPRWQEANSGKVYTDGEGMLSVPVKADDKVIGVVTSRLAP